MCPLGDYPPTLKLLDICPSQTRGWDNDIVQDRPSLEVQTVAGRPATMLHNIEFVLISCCIRDTLDHLASHFESKQ